MKETIEIAIDQIIPNRYQPRKEFNADALLELAQSIRENGLIQPIVVRPYESQYEIIAGERRYRAMVLAGFASIPCHVMNTSDKKIAQMALIENIQRENLSAIEEADAYLQLIKLKGWTQEKLAQVLGKSQSSIANKIRLMQLSEQVQAAISNRSITERHARALLQVEKSQQIELLEKIVNAKLNVAETEKLIQQQDNVKTRVRKPLTKGLTRNTKIVKNTLLQAVSMIEKAGTKVEIIESDTESQYSFTVVVKK